MSLSPSLSERIYGCTLCRACEEVCPSGVDFFKLSVAVRERIAREGKIPTEFAQLAERIRDLGRPFLEAKVLVPSPPKGDLLLFLGCMVRYRLPELLDSAVRVLRSIGQQPTWLPEEQCCGGFLEHLGFPEAAHKQAERAAKALSNSDRQVVFLCPACYLTLRDYLPDALHITEFLADYRDQLPLQSLPARIAVHDPCHLGRYAGIYDAPRLLAKTIPGAELVELPRSREKSRCCGGPLRLVHPELAAPMADRTVEEAVAWEVTHLVTSCPTCYYSLRTSAYLFENVTAAYITQLLSDLLPLN